MYTSHFLDKKKTIKQKAYLPDTLQAAAPDPRVPPKAAGSLQQLVCGNLTHCNFVWEYAARRQRIWHQLLLVDCTI